MANEYVDDAMKRTEEALVAALGEIKDSRTKFRQAARIVETVPPRPQIQEEIADDEQDYYG